DGPQPRRLRARHAVVVATGTTAAVPDLPGLRAARPWTSRDATNLQQVPRRAAIVGGGVVACEVATWLRELGTEDLTMLVRGERLLARTEPFAGDAVAAALREHGVRLRFGTTVAEVSRPDVADTGVGRLHGGPVRLRLDDGVDLEVDELIVATGRRPPTAGLGLPPVRGGGGGGGASVV
ncbi:FAD-dependent oxidoreductase, partial [Rhodococcus aetherivorans]|uniref:FAD-dependent oxidoreductase n=1 Tax=Rhodococcus aetherivorans TaxID=191292 RepID=UPI0035E9D0A2